MFKVTEPDSSKAGEESWPWSQYQLPSQTFPLLGGRSSLFLATVLPLLAPRITVDSDFQADSFPLLQGAWPEAHRWALPLPQASKQGPWPAVPESHFITTLFSPGPSSWSSCWVAWCPLGSEDWLGITTRPCLWGCTVVWGQPALPPWAPQRPFLLWVSVFTHPPMGALGRVAFRVSLRFLGSF